MDNKLSVTLNEYLPLRDVVFNTLREAILKGELVPGERLMEKTLSDRMGVSRTPIREAIRKLELEGLVLMVPRKGAEVAKITEKDITDLLEVRATLEALAARLACERMSEESIEKLIGLKNEFARAAKKKDVELIIKKDIEFHDAIFAATGNEKLIQIVSNLREQIYRFRVKYIQQMPDYQVLVNEHEEIVDSIINHNKQKAEEIVIRHIANQEKAVIEMLD
ncbi:MAG: GntR family transcriptional regulator [Firmicutes bacterium HGW-Firmicutes-1]|jgi:DNA-binding GntR family transcriptional regulator|nr:MAG: GntR family transcriptional regulator [Firmicutes bacterium HGW-Firmicutes-1]